MLLYVPVVTHEHSPNTDIETQCQWILEAHGLVSLTRPIRARCGAHSQDPEAIRRTGGAAQSSLDRAARVSGNGQPWRRRAL
jgi:hypothetical protein